MERLRNFANKIRIKLVIILFIFILVFIQYFYYANLNVKELNKVSQKNDIKASQENVPDGYVGIYTADDLKKLNGAGTDTKYILMNDIDIMGKQFEMINNFRGVLDGNYHKISNLNIESQNQYVGMFGGVLRGTVQNLILENINVKCDFSGDKISYIGALAGYFSGDTIQNVHVIGNSNIEASSNTTNSRLGGLIGYTFAGGNIIECSTAGKVNTVTSGPRWVGGLVGRAGGTRIVKCNSNAEVSNSSDVNEYCYLGGLVGAYDGGSNNYILMEECSANGKIVNNSIKTSDCTVGGIIGYGGAGTISNVIKNSYSQAIIQVKSAGQVGGIIGESSINISNCYSNAIIEVNMQEEEIYVGGLARCVW